MHSSTEMTTTEPNPEKHMDEGDEMEWETIVSTASSETERGDIDMDIGPTLPNGALLPPPPPHDSDLTLPPSSQCPNSPVNSYTDALCSQHDPEPRKRPSYKDALCTSLPAEDDDGLPIVLVEEYDPDTTLMSGAVDPRDADVPAILGLSSSDDGVMCSTINDCQHCYDKMPYRVLERGHLYELGLPFNDIRRLRVLNRDFLTTFRGVERALDEWRDYAAQMRIHPSLEIDLDEVMIVALVKRAGTSRRQVVYPEYIVPFWPPEGWDDSDDSSEAETDWEDKKKADAGGTKTSDEERPTTQKRARFELDFGSDDEYWTEIEAQGNIWDEIKVPRL